MLRTPIVSLTTTSSPLTTMPIPLRLALISVILIVLSQIPWRKIELPKAAQAQSAPEVKKPKIDHYTPLTLPAGTYRVDRVTFTGTSSKSFLLDLVHAETGAKLPFPLKACTLKEYLDRDEVNRLYGSLVIADSGGVREYRKKL